MSDLKALNDKKDVQSVADYISMYVAN